MNKFSIEEIKFIKEFIYNNINDDDILYIDYNDIYYTIMSDVLSIYISEFDIPYNIYKSKINSIIDYFKKKFDYDVTIDIKKEVKKLKITIKKNKTNQTPPNSNTDDFFEEEEEEEFPDFLRFKPGDMVEFVYTNNLHGVLSVQELDKIKKQKYFIIDRIDGDLYIKLEGLEVLFHYSRFTSVPHDIKEGILEDMLIDKHKTPLNSDIKIVFKLYKYTKGKQLTWYKSSLSDNLDRYTTVKKVGSNKKLEINLFNKVFQEYRYLNINLYKNDKYIKTIKTITSVKGISQLYDEILIHSLKTFK
jgi:hypothetical protein